MSVPENEDGKFIAMIRDNPILYDTKHFQYRDVHLKEKTWGRIAKEFHLDKFSCKKRWRHLRDGYQRYKKTHKHEFLSSNTNLTARYARLRFLDKVFSPRKPQYEVSDDDENDANAADTYGVEKPTANVKQEVDVNSDQEDYSDTTSERENIFVMQHDPITPDITNNPSSTVQECPKKDDVEYFCLHVAEVLRKLPPVEKAKAKKQLNDVLFAYELMAAQSSSEAPCTSMCNSN